MKTDIRIGSVVEHGIGGSEVNAIELIYICLLHELGQDVYSRIGINQIGDDLNEFVIKSAGNKIDCNIRYQVFVDFETKSVNEKNVIILDLVHKALIRISKHDKKLETEQLELIRNRILDNHFFFEFTYKTVINKKHKTVVAKMVVQPLMECFVFYIIIEKDDKVICKTKIYTGRTVVFFGEDFFYYGKWKGDNEFIITGKKGEVEVHIFIDGCKPVIINLTNYSNPPFFTLMQAGITMEEREAARKDWEHSLPPAIASVIRQADN